MSFVRYAGSLKAVLSQLQLDEMPHSYAKIVVQGRSQVSNLIALLVTEVFRFSA